MKKFGWAYLGCGSIAFGTAKELMQTEDQEIVAAWNRTWEKAEKFAETFGATAYRTAEEAICAPGVEAVYISVTADKHAEYMRLCIQHHKPVLCEKPFTANAKEAEDVFAYARQEGVYVAEAMWTWYNTPAWQMREWVRGGRVGHIEAAELSFVTPLLLGPHLPRLMDPQVCGGALLDIGIYCVRYAYELFGMPRHILCKGRLENGVDLGERVLFRYDDFSVKMHIAFDRKDGEWCRVTGSEGRAEAKDFHAATVVKLKRRGEKTVIHRDKTPKYACQFRTVAQEVRAGYVESEKVPAQGTIDCMKLLDECRARMGIVYPCEETGVLGAGE